MAAPKTIELSTGATVSVTDRGAGPALVLLHGVCMATTFFERNIDALASDHRVIAFDYRGHGQSPPAAAGHTVAQYARDLRALLEALAVESAVLVGWSMGSMVAWDYLAQYADDPRVSGVVIVSQGPSDLTQPGWPHGIADLAELRGFIEATQTDVHGFLAEFVEILFKDPLPEAELQALVAAITTVAPGTATSILADQTLRDYRPQIPALTVPHLLVWGADEKVVKLASGDWLAENLPAAELHVFEDSGHCPMYEEPERFNALVAEWAARSAAD
ncbi:MAG TPA: alpha/beta hydrolase [Baekduia sp.]|nr:alpha/beta hydrolase [Baekduia sp.]